LGQNKGKTEKSRIKYWTTQQKKAIAHAQHKEGNAHVKRSVRRDKNAVGG
jgi:hypothetical protein